MTYFQKNKMKAILIACAALAISACGDTQEQVSQDANEGSVDAQSTDAQSADAGNTATDAMAKSDCDTWCALRAPMEETGGWCPIGGFGEGEASCVQACEELGQTAALEPLQHCIEEDPLCFVTMEQCILGAERLASCTSWCDFRDAEHAKEGFCEPSLQSVPNGECENVCIRALQDELRADSVQECVRNNPLCFVDLQGCAGA